jgi:hypothetical protein
LEVENAVSATKVCEKRRKELDMTEPDTSGAKEAALANLGGLRGLYDYFHRKPKRPATPAEFHELIKQNCQREARKRARRSVAGWSIIAAFVVGQFSKSAETYTLWAMILVSLLLLILRYKWIKARTMVEQIEFHKCPSCNSEFSLVHSDRDDELLWAAPFSSDKRAWVDEKHRYTDTYTCVECLEKTTRVSTERRSITTWSDHRS